MGLLGHPATSAKSDVLGPHIHAHHGLGVMETTPKAAIQLFTLQLVLDPLSVRRVTDQRKHGADPFHEHRTLSRVCIIQGSLGGHQTPKNVECLF